MRAGFIGNSTARLLLGTLCWSSITLGADIKNTAQTSFIRNATPHIVAQCYTKTRDDAGRVWNPCYTCHTAAIAPNFIHDHDLQLTYSFPAVAEINPWRNLYQDRRSAIAQISDAAMRDYIRHSNYLDQSGRIVPAQQLANLPSAWDANANGQWEGYIPDAYFQFDAEGFDHAPTGQVTGWRAFAYYPFPSTNWPTNGSIGDVLIRLAPPFQRNEAGEWDRTVYTVNLAIVEALIRRRDSLIETVDEAALGGVDLNWDGVIGYADTVRYIWPPNAEQQMEYVGQARLAQRAGHLHCAAGLYPEGTELLQTLRYIDVDARGHNQLAARFKELRYAKKHTWLSYAELDSLAAAETKERHDFPDRVRVFFGDSESGVSNGQGWRYSGWIEDAAGTLRPQHAEELALCVGCHGGIGATTDSSFAFPRRVNSESFQRGWYHWSQRGFAGLAEPMRRDGQPEYAFYLLANGAGDEFRNNRDIRDRFFNADGSVKSEMLARLRQDISLLLNASAARAMQLNKAYRVLVQEQQFRAGRDVLLDPANLSVHPWVDQTTPTGINAPLLMDALQ